LRGLRLLEIRQTPVDKIKRMIRMGKSITEQEISEQPQVIQKLLDEETGRIQQIADQLRGKFKYMLIAARGTSDNAARFSQYLFGAHNRLPVALATPSLFTLYHYPPRVDEALVVGISQSGQSPDIVSVLREGRRQGRPTLAITNAPGSPLAETADHVIQLHAGEERAVAATKTYTASLAAMALFSCALESNAGWFEDLKRIPQLMEQTIAGIQPVLGRFERYRYMSHCAMVGRGFNYATTFEIALKVKELTRVVAEPYSSADFRHGPIAMVINGFPVMVIAPSGQVNQDITEMIEELTQLDSELLLISDQPALLKKANLALPIPAGVPEWLTPLVAVLPGQLFAMQLSKAKGLDPDHPRGLHKVTETL
jgi:glucosamine--fructose-6-phosphate aminotransferase (isomerizing)